MDHRDHPYKTLAVFSILLATYSPMSALFYFYPSANFKAILTLPPLNGRCFLWMAPKQIIMQTKYLLFESRRIMFMSVMFL